MNKVKPITPQEVVTVKESTIPDSVFEAFNKLIAKNFDGTSSTVKQEDIVSEIIANSDITSKEIYANHYLDIEDIYRKHGWTVSFDKPGYNETYDSFFVFKKRPVR